jgi:hypothetical protein
MTLYWNPAPLTAALEQAYIESLPRAVADAKAHSPSSKAGVELVGNTLHGTGLAGVFEGGRRGGYAIQPKAKKALKLGSDEFAAAVTGGPMAAEPFIHPAGIRWANGGFQSTARATLAARGFR